MGKQASKASFGNAKHSKQAVPSTVQFASDASSGRIGTQKLQRDELELYQGRSSLLFTKEEEIVKGLLADGKIDRAKLLLLKKHFQQRLLQSADEQLKSLMENSDQTVQAPKQWPDTMNDALSELMKKLHLVLSIESSDLLLEENADAEMKEGEIFQMLQLATMEERSVLEVRADEELTKIQTILQAMREKQEEDSSPEDGETSPISPGKDKTDGLLEVPTAEESHSVEELEKTVEILDVRNSVTYELPSITKDPAETTERDDELAIQSEPSALTKTLTPTSSLPSSIELPDVPSHSIGELEDSEKIVQPQTLTDPIIEAAQ